MALDMVKTEIDKRKESKESKFGLSQGKTFLKHDVRLSTCHSGPLINWKNTEPSSRNPSSGNKANNKCAVLFPTPLKLSNKITFSLFSFD